MLRRTNRVAGFFRFVVLVFALVGMLVACTPKNPDGFAVPAAPVRNVIPLPAEGSHSILFQTVVFRVPAGTVLGEVRVGNRVTDEMRWNRSKSQTSEFNVGITDRLRSFGYQMKDTADSLFDPGSAFKARYEMAAVLHDLDLDFEYRWAAREGEAREGVGHASVRLEVQLHDVIRKETVYTRTFSGLGEDRGRKPTPIVFAVIDAVSQVATDPDFVEIVSKRGGTASERPAVPNLSGVAACSTADPISLPEDLPRVLDSIVQIQIGRAIGSGVIVSPDGYLLTAAHVVGDADEAWVRTTRGPQLPARLVRSDPRLDIALLRIEGRGHACSVVHQGSADLELGKGVFGINVSVGDSGTPTVSRGVVSGYAEWQDRRLIQTDAAANPGSSGGPLLDDAGRVVGVTVEKIVGEGFEGLGFAVPAPVALEELGIEFKGPERER